MLTLFGKYGRGVAAAAVLSLSMGGMMAMAQDNSGAPTTQQGDQQGPPPGGPHGGEGRERHLEMMTKKLNLTPDQVTGIKAIEDDSMSQSRALRSNTSISEADKHTQMKAIRDAAQTKVRALLNDDQKTKFDAMEAQRHDRMQRGDGPPPAPPTQQ